NARRARSFTRRVCVQRVLQLHWLLKLSWNRFTTHIFWSRKKGWRSAREFKRQLVDTLSPRTEAAERLQREFLEDLEEGYSPLRKRLQVGILQHGRERLASYTHRPFYRFRSIFIKEDLKNAAVGEGARKHRIG
ncbi:PIPO, partial [Wheat streak mosaic virus]|uniref:PIPO n=1 Tax=Wheat streak mosaic virus TaxID=31741 RepID=UPI000264F5BE